TRMRARPPLSIAISMLAAPASSAFSTSSFTTLAGRSTTSPAAIWSMTALGSTAMRGMPEIIRRPAGKSIAGERDERLGREPAVAVGVDAHQRPRSLVHRDAHRLAEVQHRSALGAERGLDAQRRIPLRDRERAPRELRVEERAGGAEHHRGGE